MDVLMFLQMGFLVIVPAGVAVNIARNRTAAFSGMLLGFSFLLMGIVMLTNVAPGDSLVDTILRGDTPRGSWWMIFSGAAIGLAGVYSRYFGRIRQSVAHDYTRTLVMEWPATYFFMIFATFITLTTIFSDLDLFSGNSILYQPAFKYGFAILFAGVCLLAARIKYKASENGNVTDD